MSYYYKVVRQLEDGLLCSLNAPSKLRIIYTPNEWIKPVDGTGGIFIFKDFTNAIDFTFGLSGLEIWKCKVKNPRKLKYRATSGFTYEILDFWKQYSLLRKAHESVSKINQRSHPQITPYGTYIASQIMLVEKCRSQ